VLLISIVLPLLAVTMSPGCTASPLIMFSQLATIQCTSTPAGRSSAMARAAPSTAALPPMSYFIISIWEPAVLRL
jgi:hypothetical protein